jgi:hypothetical protein
MDELREERKYVDINTQRGMTQMLGYKEEESSSATQIKDGSGRTTMQFEVLGANNVKA